MSDLIALLRDYDRVLERFTTGDVTGFCTACRELTVMKGGRTPNVLDGQPHRKDCPIGKVRKVARAILEAGDKAEAPPKTHDSDGGDRG